MWLHYRMGLSFGRTAEVLGRLGVNVTAGAICRSSARAACTDLVGVHTELVARANRSKTITMDESGWRVGGAGAWLWVAANDDVTLCWVAHGRSYEDATEVIDAGYDGVLVRNVTPASGIPYRCPATHATAGHQDPQASPDQP